MSPLPVKQTGAEALLIPAEKKNKSPAVQLQGTYFLAGIGYYAPVISEAV